MSSNSLTAKEQEVLLHIGQGKTSKQIAVAMSLSVHTIGNHRKHICRKLGVHSTAQLVAFAALHGHGRARPNDSPTRR